MEKAIKKLEEEFNKSKDIMAQKIINNALLPELKNNKAFAERIILKDKSIDEMIKHINRWVKKHISRNSSHIDDPVVYGLAIHYFQEDEPGYVKELFDDDPIKFGDISKQYQQPVIKHITGTIIQEVVKEVEKTAKKTISKKVKKTVIEKIKEQGQQALF
jgi:glutamyl/glutaminyl-tRNA synthetase